MSVYVLSFRDRDRDIVTRGCIVEGTVDLLRTESTLTFLLHGYNVNESKGKSTLKCLAKRLHAVSGGLVATLWPGDHALGALGFPFEGDDADRTGEKLANFLIEEKIPSHIPLSFVAHSLGSRVAMKAATLLQSENYQIRQICLMAAAIDADSLADDEEFLAVSKRVDRVAVLWSRRDRVLKWAYPLGDLFMAFLHFEDYGSALGYRGPRRHKHNDVPQQVFDCRIPNNRNADHGDYLPDSTSSNCKQESATKFVADVLTGMPNPIYPP